ncbi:fumarylacetoacetate hydrolase family protein [Paenibacillus radicis (ex Xue et al. 2023)]|uniref:Fumarylacetoacetate hydrolase family protein n=1 Tax=Paenibacillus radicis (ex Xue et al. 2023) TaxID=2972489 RepID=A0ABT1YA01_9BACL|nr:fumarylacetoacetate hydrolase family protein [Paenibacillus radicis (ex Xue et al. 2023)]MCR8630024.1 fumarylacetoacetate hydrolase family protein [Paenibacillus radicis (ex Xue et al. 2023)]
MNSTRNIYCVGRNYVMQANKSNNEFLTSPLVFTKPTHALTEAKGQEIILPGECGSVYFEAELVIRIGRLYETGIKVDELVDGLAIGIDFTLSDLQNELKKKGYPWLLAKGFPNSAVLSELMQFPGVEACKKVNFALVKNGEQVQLGNIQHMLFDLQIIIDFIARHFGLGEGDIIFTGAPEGAGPVTDGDHLSLLWGEQIVGSCTIKLS